MFERLLDGKRAIITGTGDGIGRGIALAMAEAGADVAVCDLNEEELKKSVDALEETGRKVFNQVVDLRHAEQVKRFVSDSAVALGGLDTLVHNAGIMPVGPVQDMEIETIDSLLGVNFRAAILLSKYAIPHMKANGRGSITYMASVTAHNGIGGVAAYGATKGGLIALSYGLGVELGEEQIRVNTVSPGAVNSPMMVRFIEENASDKELARLAFDRIHARGQVGTIEEVAHTFVFLASDAAANITATDIRCDGGYAVFGTQPRE
ncbi:MAG: SDR family oxidoreductase [Verrucomicrobiota bacterium]